MSWQPLALLLMPSMSVSERTPYFLDSISVHFGLNRSIRDWRSRSRIILAMKTDFARARKVGLELPGVEESTCYGQPALKAGGKMFACVPSHREAEAGRWWC